MLKDCTYDKTKLLYKLSRICWFIEKHAENNAQKEGDQQCLQALQTLKKDAEKHIVAFKKLSE